MLASGCLSACALSVPVFSYGAMIPYIYSYLWAEGQRFDILQLNLHPSLFLMFVTTCGSIIGFLSRCINDRILNAFFSLTLTIIMVTIYFWGNTFVGLSLYMCLMGLCGGNILVYTIGKATEWNPSKSGAANGIIGFFVGISGLIGSFVCTVLINPTNVGTEHVFDPAHPELGNVTIFTDPDVYEMVPYIWLVFAAMFAVLFVPSVALVRSPTPDEVCELTPLLGDESFEVNKLSSAYNYSISEMLRTFKFYVLYIIVLTMSLAMLTATELYKELAAETIPDDHFLNVVGASLAIANAFGRLLWGLIMDKIGARYAMFLAFLFLSPCTIALYWTRWYMWPYFVNVCVVSFCSGIFTGIAPALVELFGHRDISLKYSLCLSGELFGCGLFYLLSVLSVSVYDDFVFLILLTVPSLLSCVLSIVFL